MYPYMYVYFKNKIKLITNLNRVQNYHGLLNLFKTGSSWMRHSSGIG